MWIREPFSATSKKHSRAFLLFLLLSLGSVHCVVTDTIEFDQAVNNPPEVLAYAPRDPVNDACVQEILQFTAEIWEPDDDLESESDLRAILIYDIRPDDLEDKDYYQFCTTSPLEDVGYDDEFDRGVVYRIECSLNLIPSDSSLQVVRLRVSDQGFYTTDQVEPGSHTAEITWLLNLVPCN